MRRMCAIGLLVWLAGGRLPALQEAPLPCRPDSFRFAVIGDNGTGDRPEFEVGQRMVAARAACAFEMVMMLGDNMYGRQSAEDFVTKFERPYAPLLQAGVPFYAALGNHDRQTNRFYKPFHMNGERYYTYVKHDVRFFVLDSNYMDPKQLLWIDSAMSTAVEPWKICYFHHPLYSDAARHGPDVELRVQLEPLLVRYGVNVVFSGHEHVYERIKPQKGITYFIAGSGGQLRKGDVVPSAETAAWFDQDQAFVVVEVARDTLFFEAISRTGRVVDSGAIQRQPTT